MKIIGINTILYWCIFIKISIINYYKYLTIPFFTRYRKRMLFILISCNYGYGQDYHMYKLSKVILFITVSHTISVFPFNNSLELFFVFIFLLCRPLMKNCVVHRVSSWPSITDRCSSYILLAWRRLLFAFTFLHASDSPKKICGTRRIWAAQKQGKAVAKKIISEGDFGSKCNFYYWKIYFGRSEWS